MLELKHIYAIIFLLYFAIWVVLIILEIIACVRIKIAKNIDDEDQIRRRFVRISIVFISICLILDIAMVLLNLMMDKGGKNISSCILSIVYLVCLNKIKEEL